MRRKQLEARRAKNRELGKQDAANRCPICKRALDATAFVLLPWEVRFCSQACVDEAFERAHWPQLPERSETV